MAAFFLVKVFWASRNSQASLVHPGVSALGKKNSTTRWPFASASENSEVLMLGALSPTWIGIRQDCRLVDYEKGILTLASLGLLLAVGLPLTAADPDAKKGQAAFESCAPCHNSDSTETKVGPGLKDLFKREKLVNGKPVNEANVKALITEGSGAMPPFGDAISAEDKDNIIAYLKTL